MHETPAQVVAAAGLASSPALARRGPRAAVAARVERLPWVRFGHRWALSWPDGVHIAVHEEVPDPGRSQAAGGSWLDCFQ